MNILRCKSPRLPHHDSVAIVIPLENRAWTDAEPLPHLGRDRDLTLRRELRMGQCHGIILPW
jgi:hypothetical protein